MFEAFFRALPIGLGLWLDGPELEIVDLHPPALGPGDSESGSAAFNGLGVAGVLGVEGRPVGELNDEFVSF